MLSQNKDRTTYENSMNALRKMCRSYHELMNSDVYLWGQAVKKYRRILKDKGILKGAADVLFAKIKSKRDLKKLREKVPVFERVPVELSEPEYFSDERIAVYTCIFGNYDSLAEPICHPDNIDYYIITDQNVPQESMWKPIDIAPFLEILQGKTAVEKNRWFKMHPAAVFSDYRYSIYIDGNVIPVTDFTEFVNRIGECGVAMFWHSYNNCVYQEALYNRYLVKKISDAELQKHVDFLREKGMPENYGMTTCNVIARDHSNAICAKIMDDWWTEFMTHCRRDQISFPYVVWKNGVKMSDIAKLGSNVWQTDTLLVIQHTD